MKTETIPKISIILPVYNPGIYFEKCILSLINQTLKEIEIIIVLDCPTDGSEKIAKKYATIDNRIIIINNQKNIHAGLSRNKGLAIAKGEYIGFHDADDYSDPSMYELLYAKVKENNLNAARCNFFCIYPSKEKLKDELYIYPKDSEDMTLKKEIYQRICNNTLSCVVWSHIFKTDFLKKYKLQFVDSSIVTSEDSVFMINVYQYLEKIGIVDEGLYHHVFHQTNMGKSYRHRSINNRIVFFEYLYEFLLKQNIPDEEALSFISENLAKSLYSASRQALLELPLNESFKQIKKITRNKLVAKSIYFLSKKNKKGGVPNFKLTVKCFVLLIWLMSKKN